MTGTDDLEVPEALTAQGDLLGVFPAIRLRGQKLELRAGESVIAYTDGVADYGPEPGSLLAQTLVGRPADIDAERLAGMLEDVARRRPGPHRNDVAIIALRFVGDEASPPRPVVLSSSGEERDRP